MDSALVLDGGWERLTRGERASGWLIGSFSFTVTCACWFFCILIIILLFSFLSYLFYCRKMYVAVVMILYLWVLCICVVCREYAWHMGNIAVRLWVCVRRDISYIYGIWFSRFSHPMRFKSSNTWLFRSCSGGVFFFFF